MMYNASIRLERKNLTDDFTVVAQRIALPVKSLTIAELDRIANIVTNTCRDLEVFTAVAELKCHSFLSYTGSCLNSEHATMLSGILISNGDNVLKEEICISDIKFLV